MKKGIGIEIGNNFIRAIILSKKRRKFKIVKVLKENWNWKDGDKLPDSFKEILIKEKSPVYLSIPKSITFFRPASFPFRSRKKILLAIPYEIEQTLPLPVEQFNFDFYELKREKDKTKIMVVAVSRENLKKLLTPFEKIGVKVSSLETNSISLFNLLYPFTEKEGKNLLLLSLTQEEAVLDIVQNRILTESRAISFSNRDELIKEILLTQKAFFGKEALEKILLVGNLPPPPEGEDGGEGGANELQEKLNVPVICPAPNPETSLAFGLALKRFIHFPLNINLIPRKKRRKILLPKKVIASLGIILFLLLIISPLFSLKKKEKEYRLLKRQINEISKSIFPSLKGTMPLKELKRKLELKGQGSEKIALLSEKEKSPLETLKRFSTIIPEDLRIEVKNIVIDRKILTISANLPSLKEIDELKKVLKNSSYFEEIKIGETRLNKEKGRVEFCLNLKIK